MRTFLIVLLTALLTLIGGGVALQEGIIPSSLLSGTGECTSTTVVKTYEEGACAVPETGDSCKTPWGTTVDHGSVVLSFEEKSATLTDGCSSKSSICNNGTYLNDDEPHIFESCALETPNNCEVNGFVFAHATTEIFYEEGTIENGKVVCQSEERTCKDGEASGGDTYVYKSCYAPGSACEVVAVEEKVEAKVEVKKPVIKATPKPTVSTTLVQPTEQRQPNCPNPFGGYRREPGQTGTAYNTNSVAYGSTCQAINIVCAYGSVRYGTIDNPGQIVGSGLAQKCTVQPPTPCSSACGTVSHGDTVSTYGQSLIPHGNGTICEDVKITSTCSNGSLSPAAGTSCSCEIAPPTPCVAPNGQTVGHGASLTLYKYPKVQALPGDGIDVCERQWRECTNGEFYDWNGNRADFNFSYPSCEVLDPPAGGGPGGQGVPQS